MDYYYIIKEISNPLNKVFSIITEQLEAQASDDNPDINLAKSYSMLINEKFKLESITKKVYAKTNKKSSNDIENLYITIKNLEDNIIHIDDIFINFNKNVKTLAILLNPLIKIINKSL